MYANSEVSSTSGSTSVPLNFKKGVSEANVPIPTYLLYTKNLLPYQSKYGYFIN